MNAFESKFTGNTEGNVFSMVSPINIPQGSNLNDYKKPGRYVSTSTANTDSLSNIPTGLSIGFVMDVLYLSSTTGFQVIYPLNSSGIIFRQIYPTNFSVWFRIPAQAYTYKQKGTLAERPAMKTSPTGNLGQDLFNVGYYYFATDYQGGKPIWWNGDGWVDATGASV